MRIAWMPLLHALPLVLWAPGAVWAGPAMARGWPEAAVLAPVAINSAAASSDSELRVLLQQGPELVLETMAQPLLLRRADGSQLGELLPGQPLRLSIDPGAPAGVLLAGMAAPTADPETAAVSELWLEPTTADGLIGLKERSYRGRLQVLRQGKRLLAINHVGLESYLPSVVGSEMPPSWPQSALRAQAVAARTYALRQRRRSEPFDLQATVASQVYKGVGSETPSTREAVAATRGQVLLYQGALIEAVFHSSSGGSTEASGDLWAQQLPYLVQVPDFDDHSPVHRWQERFEAQQLRQLFADIGGVQAITVSDRSAGGRVRRIRLEGPRGVLSLTGAELRRRLGLRSTWIEVELIQPFALARPAADATQDQGSQAMPALGQASQEPDAGAQAAGQQPSIPPPPPLPGAPASLSQAPLAGLLIRGRGFGHGVGMSQWGAHGLALRGASHTAILSHYYPGTQLHAYRDP